MNQGQAQNISTCILWFWNLSIRRLLLQSHEFELAMNLTMAAVNGWLPVLKQRAAVVKKWCQTARHSRVLLVMPATASTSSISLGSETLGVGKCACSNDNECLEVVHVLVEGSLNSKLPTIWTVEKQSRVVKSAERRCNSAKVRRKKIHPRQMLEKSRNAVFFQWFVCRVSRKVGLLKWRVRR